MPRTKVGVYYRLCGIATLFTVMLPCDVSADTALELDHLSQNYIRCIFGFLSSNVLYALASDSCKYTSVMQTVEHYTTLTSEYCVTTDKNDT